MPYEIRTASKEEVKLMIDWAAGEGWNPGVDDLEAFYAADNKGFLIGYLDDEPVSSISIVKYPGNFAFLGFYIVKPEYRGKGYGLKIWQAAMDYAKDFNIGLDGVVEQQENYKKSGFKLAYKNIRYVLNSRPEIKINRLTQNLTQFPFNEILEYDKKLFLTDRNMFLCRWLYSPNAISLVIEKNSEVAGYGVMRECREGYKIGPLFADSFINAEQLFLELVANNKSGKPVFLDIPEVNKNAYELVNKYKMTPVFETARMYSLEVPPLPVENIYGVTTFELG